MKKLPDVIVDWLPEKDSFHYVGRTDLGCWLVADVYGTRHELGKLVPKTQYKNDVLRAREHHVSFQLTERCEAYLKTL